MSYKLLGDRNFITKLMRLTFPIALQSLMLASVAAGDAIMHLKINIKRETGSVFCRRLIFREVCVRMVKMQMLFSWI